MSSSRAKGLIWFLQWKHTVFSVKYKLNLCVQCTATSVLKSLSRLQSILTVFQWRRVVYCRLAHRHGVTHHKIVTFVSFGVRTSDTKHCEHIRSNVAVYCCVVSPFTTIRINTKEQIHGQQRISAASHWWAVLPTAAFGWMHGGFYFLCTCGTNW